LAKGLKKGVTKLKQMLLGMALCTASTAWAEDYAARALAIDAQPEAAASNVPLASSDEVLFPHLQVLKPNVTFWTRIFAEISEYQSVIHSAEYPDKILAVTDFRDEASTYDLARVRSLQNQAEKTEKLRYDRLLRQVHELRNTPEAMSDEQRRVYDLYAGIDDPQRYRKAADSLRAQRGLKERTQRALEISGKYLPAMEAIFESEGLPTRLTRLPIVESSFNVEAYSKVGAAGMWQFMPSSAKMYMRLNEVVDDRADPWFSSEAAAKHLKDDYDVLGQWPLAVTAYNHGRGGVAKGLKLVGGNDLGDLIQRYQSKNFGFASRNFYAEFLAASDVERNYRTHFGEMQRKQPLRFDTATTQDYVRYSTLRQLAGIDEDSFLKLNPAYRPDVLDGKLYVPPGHLIRVPAGSAEAFRTAYANLGESELHNKQRVYYVQHRVAKGDNLGRIARRYGVSLAAVRSVNGSLGKKLRIGQIVRVPPQGASPATLVAAGKKTESAAVDIAATEPALKKTKTKSKSVKTSKAKRKAQTHRVRSGQTLSHIAKQYRVSISSLRAANGMGDSSHLKLGQKLKIPSS
jgi:membrane-bound lytic murein transglycosylase D